MKLGMDKLPQQDTMIAVGGLVDVLTEMKIFLQCVKVMQCLKLQLEISMEQNIME